HLYQGPYKVLHRNDKIISNELAGKGDTVSIERVKPEFLEGDNCQLTPQLRP
ncbi:hypothetical protein EWB00_011069, partial [Schistosoma japonicum]